MKKLMLLFLQYVQLNHNAMEPNVGARRQTNMLLKVCIVHYAIWKNAQLRCRNQGFLEFLYSN